MQGVTENMVGHKLRESADAHLQGPLEQGREGGQGRGQEEAACTKRSVIPAQDIRTSPQKAKLVLDLIRGKKASEALILRFTKKSVAREIEKALRSAIANAVYVADRNQKRRLDEDDLFVSACFAGRGPMLKRVRPAPMGWTRS